MIEVTCGGPGATHTTRASAHGQSMLVPRCPVLLCTPVGVAQRTSCLALHVAHLFAASIYPSEYVQ